MQSECNAPKMRVKLAGQHGGSLSKINLDGLVQSAAGAADRMLDSVVFLSGFGVIPLIYRSHKIAGNTPDALKRYRSQMILQLDLVAIQGDVQPGQLPVGILVLSVTHGGFQFLLG